MRLFIFYKYRVGLLLGFSVVLLIGLAVVRCLDRGFSHDEHQFIVPAVLTVRDGDLPYSDYALFHQPYPVFLNAVGIWLGGWPLLVGRVTAGLAGGATLGLLFGLGWRRLRERSLGQRFGLAWLAVLLLVASPLFMKTSGRSWNHDLATFFALAAALLALTPQNLTRRGSIWRWLAVGMLGGLAVGSRLTFAPFALLLAVIPWLQTKGGRGEKLRFCSWLCVGTVVALLPSLWLLKLAPEGYWFGNFQYPQVPYYEEEKGGIPPPLPTLEKAAYFIRKVALPDAPLLLAIFLLGVPTAIGLVRRGSGDGRGTMLWVLAAPLLLGAWAPARPHEQYFYTPAVFGLAGLIWMLPSLRRGHWVMLAGLAVVPFFWQGKDLIDWDDLFRPKNWTINKVHQSAKGLRELVGDSDGRVLTLSPTMTVEAGLEVYPELALGQFGWRCADLFSETRRRQLQLIGPGDLETRLANEPPRAILTDIKAPKIEEALVDYAKRHGYRSQVMENRVVVWLRPNKP